MIFAWFFDRGRTLEPRLVGGRASKFLYPLQDAGEDNEHRRVYGKKCSYNRYLCFWFPVIGIHGDHKEGDINGDKYGKSTPPRIDPDKGGRHGEEYLEYGEKGRIAYGDKEAIVYAENLSLGSSGRILLNTSPATENMRLSSTPHR